MMDVPPARRRAGDNFDLDSAGPARPARGRRGAGAGPAAPPPPPPRPSRPLTRRERTRLSLALAATLVAVSALLAGGAAVIDFTGPGPTVAFDAPANAPFVPVAAAAGREGGVYLRAAETTADGSAPALADPPMSVYGQPVHAVNNPAPLPPEPPPAAVDAPLAVTAPAQAGGRAVVPVGGWISTYFGSAGHQGIDIAAPAGAPVVATAPGVVRVVNDWRVSYGRHIIVDHGNGWDSLYAHLTNAAVRPGQQVAAGQVLGWVGATGNATGPHLHFEVRYRGRALDPLIFLPH